MSVGIVTVGVDGSEPSDAALRLAMEEAKLRNAVVRAVTVWEGSTLYTAGGVAELVEQRYDEYTEATRALQNEAIDTMLQQVLEAEQPEIQRWIVQGDPGYALVESSKDTDLLIVGTEHKGLLKRITVGSISAYCTRYSQIPVVVVPFVRQAQRS